MKRAAILLPGQVRTYSQAYGDFMNFLVNPNKAEWEIDIFLAFQKFTYSCNEKNSGSPHLFAINENDVVSKFNPTKFKIYTIPDDLFRDDYLKIENKIFLPKEYPLVFGNLFGNERQFYPFIYNGVMAQHYGWKQALSLLTGETTYDIVVKTRFDVVPTAPVYFSK
ncbi:MAG TPA: hypothetical protein DCM40_36850, partial [Maribacter sp.]|nr:hypothetical protein [Maribacter sp.]